MKRNTSYLENNCRTHQAELIKQGQNELSEFLSKRYESSYNSVLDSNSNQDDAVRVDKGPISFSDGSRHSGLFDHHIAKFDAESGEHAVTSEMKGETEQDGRHRR